NEAEAIGIARGSDTQPRFGHESLDPRAAVAPIMPDLAVHGREQDLKSRDVDQQSATAGKLIGELMNGSPIVFDVLEDVERIDKVEAPGGNVIETRVHLDVRVLEMISQRAV